MDDDKILQWYCSDETSEIKELYVTYTVSSDNFDPTQITKITGICPADSWRKGEIWRHIVTCPETGKTTEQSAKYINSLWRVSSKNKEKSLCVNDHISYILNIIEPAGEYFKQLCKKEEYWVTFGVHREQYCYQRPFLVIADNMRRMSELCQEISIYCPVIRDDVKRDNDSVQQ